MAAKKKTAQSKKQKTSVISAFNRARIAEVEVYSSAPWAGSRSAISSDSL